MPHSGIHKHTPNIGRTSTRFGIAALVLDPHYAGTPVLADRTAESGTQIPRNSTPRQLEVFSINAARSRASSASWLAFVTALEEEERLELSQRAASQAGRADDARRARLISLKAR